MADLHFPNLDLPATAPPVGRSRKGWDLDPAALYTLVDLSEDELNSVLTACNSPPEFDGGYGPVKTPPRARFIGEPLRAVFDYHIELVQCEKFAPIMFIVVVDRNWENEGVLFVMLDAEPHEREGKTEKIRVKVEESGSIVANIQVDNMDWDELKEYHDLANQVDEEEDEGVEEEDDRPKPSPPSDEGDPKTGPIPPRKPPSMKYCIGVYGVEGVDRAELIRNLQPGYGYAKPKDKDMVVRLQSILPATQNPEDVVTAAMDLHPARCDANPWLHKFLFFVSDTTNPAENGIILASLGGVSQERNKHFPARTWQRLPFNSVSATQDAVCMMNLGYRNWLPLDAPALMVFLCGAAEERHGMSTKIDPQAGDRVAGEEVVVNPPRIEHCEDGPVFINYSPAEAARRWPKICFEERFRSSMTRNYFVCVESAEGDDVLLVKVDWDGDVSVEDVDLRDRYEVWHLDAGVVHQTVKDLLAGAVVWGGAVPEA